LFVYLNTGDGFDNGKQWQSNLGGSNDWKNRPTHENGERSMLIDINGDGLLDRVFGENPKTDQKGFFSVRRFRALGGFSNSYHHLNCFAIVCLSQNHYLYLETHRNLVDRYLDFYQTLDRVVHRR
jgi:hypothetical protein